MSAYGNCGRLAGFPTLAAGATSQLEPPTDHIDDGHVVVQRNDGSSSAQRRGIIPERNRASPLCDCRGAGRKTHDRSISDVRIVQINYYIDAVKASEERAGNALTKNRRFRRVLDRPAAR
jgi:hypothetical protein